MRRLAPIAATVVTLAAACDRHAAPVTVFAAASTADVIGEAGRRFTRATGVEVALSFAASSTLARQIIAGAPADVFLSADEAWMDEVVAAGMAEPAGYLLANRLVLVAPADAAFEARADAGFDFAATLPQVRRIAVGDPKHVPAGRYAEQTLRALGWWAGLSPRLVPAMDVRAALRLVELGEADAGIVYATDAAACPGVVVVAVFPEGLHDPIRYPVATCRGSDRAVEFVEFLHGAEMAAVFEAAGFQVPAVTGPPGTPGTPAAPAATGTPGAR